MLERNAVVCLLGSGAFGSVSLVVDRSVAHPVPADAGPLSPSPDPLAQTVVRGRPSRLARRFSVMKRIKKSMQRQMVGPDGVDIAAERFQAAVLHHPFILELVEAGQTKTHFMTRFPFALGGDLGFALSRRKSLVLMQENQPMLEASGGVRGAAQAITTACQTPTPAPSRCCCGPTDGVMDMQCPVRSWCVTRGGLPFASICLVAFELLAALDYLATHPRRISHGDLKPDNVLIDADGHVLLADFSMMTEGAKDETPAHPDAPHNKTNTSFTFFGIFGGRHHCASSTHDGSVTSRHRGSAKDSQSGNAPRRAASSMDDRNTTAKASKTSAPKRISSSNTRRPSGATNTSMASNKNPNDSSNGSLASPNTKSDIARNLRYMPPEIASGAMPPDADMPQIPTMDVWSYGVVLLELANGVHPFFPPHLPVHSMQAMQSLMLGQYTPIATPDQPTYPADADADAREAAEAALNTVCDAVALLNDLIRSCICPDVRRRVNPGVAQHHPFFRNRAVLVHLGVDIEAVAKEAAERLHADGTAKSTAAALRLFYSDDGAVQWDAIEEQSHAGAVFADVLWQRHVLARQLQPVVVPKHVCCNGGYTVPEPGTPEIEQFATLLETSFATNASHAHRGANGAGDGPTNVSRVTILDQSMDESPTGPREQSPQTPAGSFGHRPAAVAHPNFGDAALPEFMPVDLRFFSPLQDEFDRWTDAKNKARLGRTDEEMRAITAAAIAADDEELCMSVRDAAAIAAFRSKFSPDSCTAGYTYRFDDYLK